MRESGLWHPRLIQVVTRLGHGDVMVVADAGLPVPPGVESIDLLWARGHPPLLDVLEAILAELVVETAAIAKEAAHEATLAGFHRILDGVELETIPHEQLRLRCNDAVVIVRTGGDVPYSCVALTAGVAF